MENIFLCLSGHSHSVTLVFKNIKNNSLSIFVVSVRPLVPCDTFFQIIQKNTKNSFLALLVFVRPLASCDTYFQVIQKYEKNINFQNTKISIFSNKNIFLITTWSLILHCEIRRSKASPCQVHLQKIKSFSELFFKYLLKNYVTLISHF